MPLHVSYPKTPERKPRMPEWFTPNRLRLWLLASVAALGEALEQFQQALRRAPNNGWTYYGLAQLHKARGNPKAARAAEAQLANTWIERGVLPSAIYSVFRA